MLLGLQSMLHGADVVPSVGPFAGGNTVAITNGASGTITNVLVDGLPATIQNLGPNWVQITMPSTGSAGQKDILIQTSDNGDTSLPDAYTVNPPGEIFVFPTRWMDYRVAFFGNRSTDPKRAYVYPTNTALDGVSRWTYYNGASTSFLELMSTNGLTGGVQLRAFDYDQDYDISGWNTTLPGYDWIATNAAMRFIWSTGNRTNRIVLTNLLGSSYQVDIVNSYNGPTGFYMQNEKLFSGVWNTGDSLAGGDFGTNASTTWQNPGGGGNNLDVATIYNNPDRYVTWGAVTPSNNAITIVQWPGAAGVNFANCLRIRGYEPDPTVQGVTPTNGSCAGGFEVTINGTNLCNGSDLTAVTLCGVNVQSIVSQSPTQIVVAAAPATAATGDVRIFSTSYGETVAANAFTYEKIVTATTLSSTPNPSTYGEDVTFTATVSPGTSTGTVVFKDGTVSLGTATLSSGIATLVLDSLMVSNHNITAEYSGSSVSATSTSSAVTQTVNKATPTVSTWPTASAITYNQTLADSTLSGGTTSVPGTFAFTTPTTAPVVGAASQNVTFTPTDTNNYNAVAGTVSVTVNKATPTVSTWPTASAITYNQTLADSTLTGGTASIPGSFAFTSPTTAPVAGTASQDVTFTPTDIDNYNTVAGTVSVTVNKATPTVSTWPTASAITYNQTLADSTLTGGAASVPGSFGFTTPTTAPVAGTASQNVTFTPTDSDNYNTVAGTVSVTVNKATPTVSTWPTASAITYNQTLADSTLSGGAGSVPGSFAFTTPTTAPVAGSASQNVTFTPTDTDNYNTVAGTVSVTVNKATPTVTTWPTASAITYNQTLADSPLTGGAASVPGNFAFTTPTTAPVAGTASHDVTFTPTDTDNYNTVAGTVSVTVNKATPTVTTWPTASTITYNQTLADSTLTGGSTSVPGSFAFTTPTTAPVTGTASQNVTFTPTDSDNYNTVAGTVSVTVNKATPTVSTWPTASAITYNQTLADSTLTGGTGSVPGSFAFTTPTTAPVAGTASQNVTFTPTDTDNYNTVAGTVSVTVNKATPTVSTWPTASTITYNQTLADSTLTGGTASVPGSFAFTTPTTAPVAGTASQNVTFTPTDTDNYNTVAGTVSVTVNKATPTVSTWPTASAITYNQTLADSTLTGGAASVPGSFAFTTPTTAPVAGTASHDVTFTPTDSDNYNTVAGTISVTVNKATPTVSTWPTASAITYNQTLADSTLTGGATSVPGSFAFTTPATAPVAGTASQNVTFTPTDTDNYNTVAGTVSVTVNKATPTVSTWPTASAITYNQILADSTLTGGAASLPGSFAFTTPTTAPVAGTASQDVTFTPTDTDNYNTVAGTVSVTVNKATPTVTTWPTASAITYNQNLADSTLTGGAASVPGSFAFTAPTTAPVAGTASQDVTFTPTDSDNYNTVAGTVSVTVNKATPTVTTWPTASVITYNQTLADSTLTGGAASVPGSFAFTTPTTAPVAGTASHDVTFTPTDSDNYNTVAGTISVTVNKATPTVSTWPTASAITYNQTLADSTLTGGAASVPGSFAFTTPTTAPVAGTSSQGVTFTPTDSDNYNTVAGTVSVTVGKATPVVSSWPTATELNHGQTLASSVLLGGTASVPGTFGFTTPTFAPPDGKAPQDVTFTPADTDKYKAVSATVSVTVNANGQAPVAAHDTIHTIKNREVSVSATKLLANDTDADGDTLTITEITSPGTSGGKVVFAAGTITYTPPTNFIGTDFFSYTVNDGRGYQANANVKVVINSDVAAPLNVVSGPVLTNGQFTVRFTGTPGTTYSVEYSDTINNPVWHWLINVTTPSTSATGEIEFTDPVGTNTNRYYRTVYPPYYDN
jgi:hypothetical protein